VLTRSIDFDDPFDLSFEEKLFFNAKRLCVYFALAALTISGLDLMNIRPLESAAEFIHEHRDANVAEWPALIRTGIQQISLSPPPSVTVAIPSDVATAKPPVVAAAKPVTVAAKAPETAPPKSSALKPVLASVPAPIIVSAKRDTLVDDLASARHEDAVEMAMSQPGVLAKASASDMARQAQDMLQQSRENVAKEAAEANASAPSNEPAPGSMQLASATADVLPQSVAPRGDVIQISLPAHIGVLPPPAPGVPPPSPAQRLHLEGKDRAKAERCLSDAIYFEARDQPYQGQVAVAQVVINRVFSGVYPRDVCGVIYQNASHHLACQFTFACDGKRKTINEFGSWARARRIARETLDGQLYVQAVGTSTHYHATYVHPNWVHEMHRFAREGIHLFYRPIAWGNGSDEPIWSRAQLASNKQASNDKKR
jgi:cell wall hydrolase